MSQEPRATQRSQFDYLLNAFEQASQSEAPSQIGYAQKRQALFDYVRGLERDLKEMDEENTRLLGTASESTVATHGDFLDFYADLTPAKISVTKDPMVTLDYYDLPQLRAAFDAGRKTANAAPQAVREVIVTERSNPGPAVAAPSSASSADIVQVLPLKPQPPTITTATHGGRPMTLREIADAEEPSASSAERVATPDDEEIKAVLIAYEAAVYEDNSDEESIEPHRDALLAVLVRCRDAARSASSSERVAPPGWLAELTALEAKATPGPYFVATDSADDCAAHRDSGLALIDTGRESDWPVLRLGEWPTTEFIAALLNAWPHIKALASSAAPAERVAPEDLRGDERRKYIHDHDCPKIWDFWHKHALGSKSAPSCLLCGAPVAKEQWAITHAELPNIFICACCVEKVRHPSASSATSFSLPDEATPEMVEAVSAILQPYAAKMVWRRMRLAFSGDMPNAADRGTDG